MKKEEFPGLFVDDMFEEAPGWFYVAESIGVSGCWFKGGGVNGGSKRAAWSGVSTGEVGLTSPRPVPGPRLSVPWLATPDLVLDEIWV